jgi:hypothetical protein
MRRTVLLGAVAPVLALGFVACAQAVLLAQSPKTPVPLSPTPAPSGTVAAPIRPQTPAPVGVAAPLDSLTPLAQPFATFPPRTSEANSPALDSLPIRQRFIELSRKKAYALNEEQLKREVDTMEAEVRELEAWAKAQEAVRLLHEVIEKHPNTKAAATANAAIQLIEQRRTPANDPRSAQPFSPRRDDTFESAPRFDAPRS